MKGLVSVGSICLIFGTMVFVGRSWSEGPKEPVAPRTRVALLNMVYVLKNYESAQDFQQRMKAKFAEFQKKEGELRLAIEEFKKVASDPTSTAELRENAEMSIKTATRQLEDNTESAKKSMGAEVDKETVSLFVIISKAVKGYAKEHRLDLVLTFNDNTEEDPIFLTPAAITRKMQTQPCMPIYAEPGMDISKEIITLLNDDYRKEKDRK